MPDCWEVGRSLQRGWLDNARNFREQFASGMRAALANRDPRLEFPRSLYQHARGNSEYLIAYLRSDKPFTSEHRELLAQILDGALDRPLKPVGRPSNQNARCAARLANAIFKEWRKRNEAEGVKDWGQRGAMREECARFVVKELDPSEPPLDCETVLGWMSKSREN